MEEDCNSWVLRSRFSHKVCHRRISSLSLESLSSDSSSSSKPKGSDPDLSSWNETISNSKNSRLDLNPKSSREQRFKKSTSSSPSNPISIKSKSKLEVNMKILSSDYSNVQLASKISVSKPGLDANSRKSGNERNSKPKQRSVSPLPTIILSDIFKEATSIGKRFSTPPPKRRNSDKTKDCHVLASSLPLERSQLKRLSSMEPCEKLKYRKDNAWARGVKVAALESIDKATLENIDKWNVDLSKLYLGLRFACGAHSRLYHGVYLDQPVAVKIIRQPDDDENGMMAARLEKQFTREVMLLSRLHHPNVIKLAGACKNLPVFCIITEYLPGGSLRAFLHKLEQKSLPLPKLIGIAIDIARGMKYIHSKGIIHRDLKPENMIFDQDFCIKIVDFGIACEEAHCDAFSEEQGTYRWMAPEIIKHKRYGRKVDVYSFGLLLWEMVTGRIPYEDLTPIQAAYAVFEKKLRPIIPANCPAPLRALIEQCWAVNPEKRPEFWQIVKVLEQFKCALAQDGTLNQLQCLTGQDHKKRLSHWIEKLKLSHTDSSRHRAA